jgi:hypothetical protein
MLGEFSGTFVMGEVRKLLSTLCEADTDGELAKGIRRDAPITVVSKSVGQREETREPKRYKATRNRFIKDVRTSVGGNDNCS